MNQQNSYQNQNENANTSLDYDSWVHSLGNIQDGIFQNTPITNHIISNGFVYGPPQQQLQLQQQHHQQQQQHGPNPQLFQQIPNGIPPNHDLTADMFFNSPERFYRDIINESPVINRTPHHGRTPLRNLSINFSTPNFLKSIDTSNTISKGFTPLKAFSPLKNQPFTHNDSMFQTPNDKKQDSTLNSSPTTIKMNSSAVKNDDSISNSKGMPLSPTPASKIPIHQQQKSLPVIPKMGFFKKQEDKPKIPHSTPVLPQMPVQQQTRRTNHPNNAKFQIIISDVNTFANPSKNSSKKKKKLARSSTTVNATSSSSKTITKKTTLKRSISQPHSKIGKVPIPNELDAEKILNTSSNLLNVSNVSTDSIIKGQSEISVEDLFDERILSDTENLNNW